MNEVQLLRNPDIQPDGEAIAGALGAANSAYTEFIDELKDRDIHAEWRYYNDSKAWLAKAVYSRTTQRGAKKETTIFWLSIWDGFFRVSVFVPEKYRKDAHSLAVSEKTRKMIETSAQIGKLNFFPLVFDVGSNEMFGDIFALAEFKKAHT